MEIRYTKHTEDKIRTKEAKKFSITKEKIKMMVKNVSFDFGMARLITSFDRSHDLCVILKKEGKVLKVITFFPAEKGRYESKVLS